MEEGKTIRPNGYNKDTAVDIIIEEYKRSQDATIPLPYNYLTIIDRTQLLELEKEREELDRTDINQVTMDTDEQTQLVNQLMSNYDDKEEILQTIEEKYGTDKAKQIGTIARSIFANTKIYELKNKAYLRQAGNYLYSEDNYKEDVLFILDNANIKDVLLLTPFNPSSEDGKILKVDLFCGVQNILLSNTQNATNFILQCDGSDKRKNPKKYEIYTHGLFVISRNLAKEYTDKLLEEYPDLLDLTLAQALKTYGEDTDGKLSTEIQRQELKRVKFNKVDKVTLPIDKINHNVWKFLEEADNGQLSINFNFAKHNSGNQALVYYSISFDELENIDKNIKITKKLTPFDKRVMISVTALFNAGNTVVTTSQIYKAMGNLSRPNTSQIEKVNNSLTKMMNGQIILNNSLERYGDDAEAKQHHRQSFVYEGAIIPAERGSYIVDGKVVESAIHIFREPPLVSFAKEYKQITTIKQNLLYSPLNKTDKNLLIEDYLLERIAQMKRNGKKKGIKKILFDTIYEECNRTTEKQQQRTADVVYKYLDFYVKEKNIKGYWKEKDGVTIIL